jgi:hypothetical protein
MLRVCRCEFIRTKLSLYSKRFGSNTLEGTSEFDPTVASTLLNPSQFNCCVTSVNKIMYVYLLMGLSIFKVGIDYNLRPDKAT